ncbi:MAG: FAD-dependent thymidylate synthase [Candidatus Micrarchaeota archaeon]|nr:FAD-dependent thymidylate synthase [Candidatus Micrarchaeota archaeon]
MKNPGADAQIGVERKVLDHGVVMLVDYMGGDESIVRAARVSYGAGTKTLQEDKALIKYLLRHSHTTPFEMVEMAFYLKMPIFVMRQIVRHRTANMNEMSLRYSIELDVHYVPELDAIQGQSTSNRQGREEKGWTKEAKENIQKEMQEHAEASYALYQKLIQQGVAREIARFVLPVTFYTECYWKMDLWNLFHFLALRMDAHAQFETREFANAMADVVKGVAPGAFEAFEEYIQEGVKLSKKDQVAVTALLRGATLEDACSTAGLKLTKPDGTPLKMGEGPEFLQKLEIIKEKAVKRG